MVDRYHQRKPAFMYPWRKRTLFIGNLPPSVNVAYGAATLVVSLGNPIGFAVSGRLTHCYSLLLPAGMPVTLIAGNAPVAICHLDVLGDDYKRFQGCFVNAGKGMSIAYELQDEADFRYLFNKIYRQPSNSEDTCNQINDLLEFGFARAGNQSVIDQNVIAAVDHIKQSFQINVPIEELAKQVKISAPSLIRKFKQQSGVPIRRFRVWHRIWESMIFISDGQSLTDAAINAGFSDSPHYAHAVHSMWGVSPSDLFLRGIGAEILTSSK